MYCTSDGGATFSSVSVPVYEAAKDLAGNEFGYTPSLRGIRLPLAQKAHTLTAHRLGKHIHWLNLHQLIFVLTENLQISGQGGGFAGDVYHPVRLHGQNRIQQFPPAAFTRRVHHNYIGPLSRLLIAARQNLLRPAHIKCGVGNPIGRRVGTASR